MGDADGNKTRLLEIDPMAVLNDGVEPTRERWEAISDLDTLDCLDSHQRCLLKLAYDSFLIFSGHLRSQNHRFLGVQSK